MKVTAGYMYVIANALPSYIGKIPAGLNGPLQYSDQNILEQKAEIFLAAPLVQTKNIQLCSLDY